MEFEKRNHSAGYSSETDNAGGSAAFLFLADIVLIASAVVMFQLAECPVDNVSQVEETMQPEEKPAEASMTMRPELQMEFEESTSPFAQFSSTITNTTNSPPTTTGPFVINNTTISTSTQTPSTIPPDPFPVNQCGKEIQSQSSKSRWPWLISLVKEKLETGIHTHFCAATIVSPRHALTSKSCLNGMTEEEILKTVGAIYGKHLTNTPGEFTRFVEVHRHPKGATDASVNYDFALLTFERGLQMGARSYPVCLPPPEHKIDRWACYTIAWQESSAVQTQCRMIQVSQQSCLKHFGEKGGFKESAFCSSVPKDKQKCMCRIDRGGPLICKERSRWYLYGIMSDKEDCFLNRGLFAQVSHSVNWLCCFFPDISSCIRPDVDCDYAFAQVTFAPTTSTLTFASSTNSPSTTRETLSTITPRNLWISSDSFPVNKCGKEIQSQSNKSRWPWLISLVKKKSETGIHTHFCAATIVSPRHALTSKSCLNGMTEEEILTTVGAIYGKHIANTPGEYISFVEVRHHPKASTDASINYDLALLTFERELQMGARSYPVCLPAPERRIDGRTCYTIGWHKSSTVQTQCRIIPVSQELCSNYFGTKGGIQESAFCSSVTKDEQKCLCRIDRGGPLICEENNRWHLFGVLSDNESCFLNRSLFAQVSHSLNWLCCFFPDMTSCKRPDIDCDFAFGKIMKKTL